MVTPRVHLTHDLHYFPQAFSYSEDLSSLSRLLPNNPCQRTGVMAAFNNMSELERYTDLYSLNECTLLPSSSSMFDSIMGLFSQESDDSSFSTPPPSPHDLSAITEEPPLQMKIKEPPGSPGTVSASQSTVLSAL